MIIFLAIILIYRTQKGYSSNFKKTIIGKIIKFINSNLEYYYDRGIEEDIYKESKIFLTKHDRYRSEDLVRGMIGETYSEFSEIETTYESGSNDNKSENIIFKGLFFVADFNKKIKSKTFVLPDLAQK